jgi:hypothetical protein
VNDTAWCDTLTEIAEVFLWEVIVHFGLFLGVQVIEIAEELVESVICWQVFVEVAQVVLAKLAGCVSLVLEQGRDGHCLFRHPDGCAWESDFGQTRAVHALASDKRRSTRSATLLPVGVSKPHALLGEAVDVRGLVSHEAVGVTTEVGDADVVTPNDQDVRLGGSFLRFRRHSLFLHG